MPSPGLNWMHSRWQDGALRSHTEGPADDESVPRKLEGWWRVLDYQRDAETEVLG